ncbi:MAG: hypothetical protein BZY88_05340 [SAR202 cluster bacterium Io17-Chloro-G9]|nr:MAG: hypothetical protein BZY88_05340 [SAR202 cluster bacterium Io17-Chloro-G9]
MLAAACGGDDAAPTFTRGAPTATTAASQPADTVGPTATTAAPANTVAAPAAGASLEISVDGDALTFDKDNFDVASGSEVVLVFDNVSAVNQHNWVLVAAGTKDDVAGRGTAAGPGNAWVEPGDPDVIANTALLDPGVTGDVRFTAPAAGTYQFVCTFPGHNFTMFGDFVVTP